MTATAASGGLQVNVADLRQAARDLAGLSADVGGLAAVTTAASTLAASACPGWETGAASSAAGGRWHQAVRNQAGAVAGAGDRLTASAATYEVTETALVQKISAISQPAGL
jgi:uncharacterized protein YukE